MSGTWDSKVNLETEGSQEKKVKQEGKHFSVFSISLARIITVKFGQCLLMSLIILQLVLYKLLKIKRNNWKMSYKDIVYFRRWRPPWSPWPTHLHKRRHWAPWHSRFTGTTGAIWAIWTERTARWLFAYKCALSCQFSHAHILASILLINSSFLWSQVWQVFQGQKVKMAFPDIMVSLEPKESLACLGHRVRRLQEWKVWVRFAVVVVAIN